MTEADRRFLAVFEVGELNAAEFRHREHVRIAYIYLTLYRLGAARRKTIAAIVKEAHAKRRKAR